MIFDFEVDVDDLEVLHYFFCLIIKRDQVFYLQIFGIDEFLIELALAHALHFFLHVANHI